MKKFLDKYNIVLEFTDFKTIAFILFFKFSIQTQKRYRKNVLRQNVRSVYEEAEEIGLII